jgi:hypothetical protein
MFRILLFFARVGTQKYSTLTAKQQSAENLFNKKGRIIFDEKLVIL